MSKLSNTNRSGEPPVHLSPESKAIWREAIRQYDLSLSDLSLLRLALENRDLGNAAREDLRKRSNVLPTKDGFKTNPSAQIAKGHDQLYLSAMRQLGLDVEDGPEERE